MPGGSPGLFLGFSERLPDFCEGFSGILRDLPAPGDSGRAWPDGHVATYVQGMGVLRGFHVDYTDLLQRICREFAGEI